MAFRSPDSMVNVVVTMVIDDRILFFVVYLHTIYSIFCVLRFEFSNFGRLQVCISVDLRNYSYIAIYL